MKIMKVGRFGRHLSFALSVFGAVSVSLGARADVSVDDKTLAVEIAVGTENLSDWLSARSLTTSDLANYTNIVKSGVGVLTNDVDISSVYSGRITVAEGRMVVSVAGAFGDDKEGTYVLDGATLDYASNADFRKETVTFTGTGTDGKGAIYKSLNATCDKMFGNLVLSGDAMVGNVGNRQSMVPLDATYACRIDFNGSWVKQGGVLIVR